MPNGSGYGSSQPTPATISREPAPERPPRSGAVAPGYQPGRGLLLEGLEPMWIAEEASVFELLDPIVEGAKAIQIARIRSQGCLISPSARGRDDDRAAAPAHPETCSSGGRRLEALRAIEWRPGVDRLTTPSFIAALHRLPLVVQPAGCGAGAIIRR